MKKNWKKTLIYENQTIEEVLKNYLKLVFKFLYSNKSKKLVGTITDGDLRSTFF